MFHSTQDKWHYPRNELCKKLVLSIQHNIIHSFTLFAPRRIGKTYFLNYDLKPALESQLGYQTIYFSFAEQVGNHLEQFRKVLIESVDLGLFRRHKISEVSFSWCKISIKDGVDLYALSLLQLLSLLAHQAKNRSNSPGQVVLLLDEIQELINIQGSDGFIGELRTALDLNKSYIKVIFTGSSRDELRKMFNDNKAPFFHFGTSLNMEPFGSDFTDYLADVYHNITGKLIDKVKLFEIFKRLNFVTLSIREFIAHLMMCDCSIDKAYDSFEAEIISKNSYVKHWQSFSTPVQLVLFGIANSYSALYSEGFYSFVKETFNINITQGKIQNSINRLLKSGVIHENDAEAYEIDDAFLARWITIRRDDIITMLRDRND